jgi:hypothetical protein
MSISKHDFNCNAPPKTVTLATWPEIRNIVIDIPTQHMCRRLRLKTYESYEQLLAEKALILFRSFESRMDEEFTALLIRLQFILISAVDATFDHSRVPAAFLKPFVI